jgi:Ca2+-binding RTX toxin-like protein
MPGWVTATIDAGNGNNTIIAGYQTSKPKQLIVPYKLDDILGPVTLVGGAATDSLRIDDHGNGFGQLYQFTASQLLRKPSAQSPTPIVIGFLGMETVRLQASDNAATNGVVVSGTPAGSNVDVDPGIGDAQLSVGNLDAILGPLNFNWTSGNKNLTVADQSAAEDAQYDLTNTAASTTVQRTGAAPIALHGTLSSINLFAGLAHMNTVNVDRLAAGTPAAIFAGAGQNQVTVTPLRNLDNIAGPLQILGNGPTQVIFDDRNGPGSRNYVLTASSLSFSAAQPPVQFFGVSAINLLAAAAAVVNVPSTSTATPVQVLLKNGTNQVVVGSANHTLDSITGAVTVRGQNGLDTVVLNDQNGPGKMSYSIGASAVSSGQSAPIQFSNVDNVVLGGSPGPDVYQVTGVPATTQLSIVAQGSGNLLAGPNQANLWVVTGPDSGALDSTVAFHNLQSLLGGAGPDAFRFQPLGSLTGSLDGGGGENLLDYSQWQNSVTVNLAKGTAAAVAKGVVHTEDVTGGGGDDLIVGDNQPNILHGGAGSDILIGGSAADILDGGAGEDIVIGGTTAYDSGITALNALMAEWARKDQTFPQRKADLMSGVGPGQQYKLSGATVFDDQAVDTVTSSAGQDWVLPS